MPLDFSSAQIFNPFACHRKIKKDACMIFFMLDKLEQGVELYFYFDRNGTGKHQLVYGIKKGNQLIGFDGKNYTVDEFSSDKLENPYIVLDALRAYIKSFSKKKALNDLIAKGYDKRVKPYIDQVELLKEPKKELEDLERILMDDVDNVGL